jgi:hypothetical protein
MRSRRTRLFITPKAQNKNNLTKTEADTNLEMTKRNTCELKNGKNIEIFKIGSPLKTSKKGQVQVEKCLNYGDKEYFLNQFVSHPYKRTQPRNSLISSSSCVKKDIIPNILTSLGDILSSSDDKETDLGKEAFYNHR